MADGLSSDQAKTHSGPPDSLTRASRLASRLPAGCPESVCPRAARLSARLPAVSGSSVLSNVSRNRACSRSRTLVLVLPA